jgi:hypothetical protein
LARNQLLHAALASEKWSQTKRSGSAGAAVASHLAAASEIDGRRLQAGSEDVAPHQSVAVGTVIGASRLHSRVSRMRSRPRLRPQAEPSARVREDHRVRPAARARKATRSMESVTPNLAIGGTDPETSRFPPATSPGSASLTHCKSRSIRAGP